MILNDSSVRRINNQLRPLAQYHLLMNCKGRKLGDVANKLNQYAHEMLVSQWKKEMK